MTVLVEVGKLEAVRESCAVGVDSVERDHDHDLAQLEKSQLEKLRNPHPDGRRWD